MHRFRPCWYGAGFGRSLDSELPGLVGAWTTSSCSNPGGACRASQQPQMLPLWGCHCGPGHILMSSLPSWQAAACTA